MHDDYEHNKLMSRHRHLYGDENRPARSGGWDVPLGEWAAIGENPWQECFYSERDDRHWARSYQAGGAYTVLGYGRFYDPLGVVIVTWRMVDGELRECLSIYVEPR